MENRISRKVDNHLTIFKQEIKDWFDKNNRHETLRHFLAQKLIDSINAVDEPIGIMLHHQKLQIEDFEALSELLQLVSAHNNVKTSLMRDLISSDL